jgi:hypothetical protein
MVDPKCEDIDCLHLHDAYLQRENNYGNSPWGCSPRSRPSSANPANLLHLSPPIGHKTSHDTNGYTTCMVEETVFYPPTRNL